MQSFLKHFDSFCFLFFFAYFLFKQIMHGYVRERKEILNDVKLLTLHFCYAEAYICHFMIGRQQWWDGYLCFSLRIFYSFSSKRVIWVLSTRDHLTLLITNTSHKAHLFSCAYRCSSKLQKIQSFRKLYFNGHPRYISTNHIVFVFF